ncbi:hypothetical protein ARMGADRAFT_1039560 [Armillaria gallica]|uniref:Uncharacterized protein n=1 Tax=Armillaria gallica TaxID=47427 RepID=A0A2H3CI88_ARMGA|nr:hypothetical protein ARMGADRAFT_1039560 [Armillaria gallica]
MISSCASATVFLKLTSNASSSGNNHASLINISFHDDPSHINDNTCASTRLTLTYWVTMRCSGYPIVWIFSPVHENAVTLLAGYKACHFSAITEQSTICLRIEHFLLVFSVEL